MRSYLRKLPRCQSQNCLTLYWARTCSDGRPARQDTVQDFQDSDKVYAFIKQKKITVIQDDFSFIRNQGLYAAFNLIENKWRMLVLRDTKLAELIEKVHPQDYRSKIIDNKAAQYHLSEFYESFLRAPAADEYIIEQWEKSKKTSDDLIRVKALRMLDQLRFPLADDELESLRETRNQCMHFRVTTLATYIQTIELVNRYVKDFEMRELTEAISRVIDPQIKQLSQMIEKISVTSLSDLATHMARVAAGWKN